MDVDRNRHHRNSTASSGQKQCPLDSQHEALTEGGNRPPSHIPLSLGSFGAHIAQSYRHVPS